MDYDVPVDVEKCRSKLKDNFLANKYVADIRAIDMLVAKVLRVYSHFSKKYSLSFGNFSFQGQMELRETIEVWKQKTHFMAFFRDSVPEKKTDFLSKFLDSKN
jgi:NADH dehydrogenase (ubiquinone) 1 alpha subcomplex subunit 6